ncbi:ArsR/SmtB family transcription factor [Mycolicibacterium aichiense]|uniref:Transcriptional regulator n=1 Tax=Mycolicibacterium aichiense TaxID=1799 RepID=A0AAD1HIC3_9MYCO|nr:metalloregulator ArsR/SmtB family transcription factor [Mycolicibacterium aichiense]MCV7020793.1 winged helix-turn-helix transcriptional regulator [Mycolicibacterium aichiense]BBX05360.1 transcriptional regulator [Mycolicibacterium aichiense]STZ25288.1 ArsR family transcriptional regulator [Mycolicibacterium aichiense]
MPTSFPAGDERPLYEIKANLFKALAHPARIRVLEILSANDRPTPVSEILAATEIEPTLLSQHLAVLKRHHVVSSQRTRNAVHYELAHPSIRDLLVSARGFLADTLKARHEQLSAFDALPPVGHPQ